MPVQMSRQSDAEDNNTNRLDSRLCHCTYIDYTYLITTMQKDGVRFCPRPKRD